MGSCKYKVGKVTEKWSPLKAKKFFQERIDSESRKSSKKLGKEMGVYEESKKALGRRSGEKGITP